MSDDKWSECENEIEEQHIQSEIESSIRIQNSNDKEKIINSNDHYSGSWMKNFNDLLEKYDVKKIESLNDNGASFILDSGQRGYLTSSGKFMWD